MRKTIMYIFMAIVMIMSFCMLFACNSEIEDIVTISFDKVTMQLDRYESGLITAIVSPNTADAVWASSNDSIVVVNDGEVSARGAGSAVITLSSGDAMASCNVTVIDTGLAPIIVFDKDRIDVVEGGSVSLSASVMYGGTQREANLSFVSAETSIATISNDVVSGVVRGETFITASVNFYGTFLSATIDVETKVDISINFTETTNVNLFTRLVSGKDYEVTKQLAIEVERMGATITPIIIWSSYNQDIATVNNGLVTALVEGSTVIRAECTIEGITIYAERNVFVARPIIDSGEVYEVDKRDTSTFYIDISGFLGITDVKCNDINIGTIINGNLSLNTTFTNRQDNCYKIKMYAVDAIYLADINLFTRYGEIALSSFVVDPIEATRVSWTNVTDSQDGTEQTIIGSANEVYRFSAPAQAWVWEEARIMNFQNIKASYDYIVFKAFFTDNSVKNMGLYVGSADYDLTGPDTGIYVMDGGGTPLASFISGEWMTIVVKFDEINTSTGARLSFTPWSTSFTCFYIKEMRTYTEALMNVEATSQGDRIPLKNFTLDNEEGRLDWTNVSNTADSTEQAITQGAYDVYRLDISAGAWAYEFAAIYNYQTLKANYEYIALKVYIPSSSATTKLGMYIGNKDLDISGPETGVTCLDSDGNAVASLPTDEWITIVFKLADIADAGTQRFGFFTWYTSSGTIYIGDMTGYTSFIEV